MAHSQEDHLSEWIEVEQERDFYREQYEVVLRLGLSRHRWVE